LPLAGAIKSGNFVNFSNDAGAQNQATLNKFCVSLFVPNKQRYNSWKSTAVTTWLFHTLMNIHPGYIRLSSDLPNQYLTGRGDLRCVVLSFLFSFNSIVNPVYTTALQPYSEEKSLDSVL